MTDIPPLHLPLPSDLTPHETLIVMWIGSDPPLLDELRDVAQGNEFVADDVQLATTVSDLLWDPAYGVSLPNLTHVTAYGGSVLKASLAQSAVPWCAFRDIDLEGWARIRTALLAGTENAS